MYMYLRFYLIILSSPPFPSTFQVLRTSSRRNLFSQDRRTVSVTRPTQTSRVPSSFYGRVTTVNESRERSWLPGESIPTGNSTSPSVEIHSLLSEMQCSISSKLTQLQGTLSSIVSRLSQLEESVASNTAKLSSQPSCSTPVSTPSTSSCESSGGCPSSRKRKRRLPTELSNLVRIVHNNLPEEKRLKKSEIIDSEHNLKVVGWVADEVPAGSEYSRADIKKALQTYRKTLARCPKESEHSQRLKRSRQQKKYERRGRYVKPEEMNKWAKVEPSMMSDEEAVDGKFKVHRQEWRSEEFNNFMEELDDRASVSNSKPHPRLSRFHGTPQKIQPPPNALEWMINNVEVLAPNSPN